MMQRELELEKMWAQEVRGRLFIPIVLQRRLVCQIPILILEEGESVDMIYCY